MKKTLLIGMTIGLILALVACGQNNVQTSADPSEEQIENASNVTSTDGSGEKISVYVSGPEAMLSKLEEAFEENNGDVLDLSIMSSGQLRSKVWAENEAGKIQADVIWGSDPLIYNKLDEAGMLEPLEIKDISNIDENYVWDGKNYALVNERYITIMYNTEMLTEEPPKSFADLKDEKYNGLAVMADANQSSTAFATTSALYSMENGSDYFQALKDNGIKLIKADGLVPSSIMEGQFTVGIAPHDSVVRLKNKGKKEGFEVPLQLVWPSEGVVAIQRPVAIPADDTRPVEKAKIANKFVNFLLSKKAQTITAKFGFVSVRKDIENTFLPEDAEVFSVDWDEVAANEESIKNEYQSIMH